VLRARLKTTGVVEHTFTLRGGATSTLMDWKIYDVGGERSQRQAWAPYFDDVNAIIFLGASHALIVRVETDTYGQRRSPRSTRCSPKTRR
jgi:hypothetical protein